MKIGVWNYKKYSKKQMTGYMGGVDINLAFLANVKRNSTVCKSLAYWIVAIVSVA